MKATTRTGSMLGLAATAALLVLSGCGNAGMTGSDTTAEPTLTQEFPSAPPATAEGSPSPSGPGSLPATDTAKIVIKDFRYQGAETVSPGAEIAVSNEDIEAHTITADTGTSFDANVKPGSGTLTAPTTPGTYSYHCKFHANMKGTLTVK